MKNNAIFSQRKGMLVGLLFTLIMLQVSSKMKHFVFHDVCYENKSGFMALMLCL